MMMVAMFLLLLSVSVSKLEDNYRGVRYHVLTLRCLLEFEGKI